MITKKKKVHFFTLGCKINIYDSEILKDKFNSAGYELVKDYRDNADIVVINSCTVTAKADKKFRDYVKKIRKYDEDIIIAAVGCYTQLETDKIITLDKKGSNNNGINIILGTNNKYEIICYIDEYFRLLNNNNSINILEETKKSTKEELNILHTDKTEFYDYNISDFKQHTRAFLKVQDGCDNFCTYCTIPKARGRSRSKPLNSVIRDTRNLVKNGYKEIVISGIDLGSYSYHDSENKITIDLAELIIDMLKIEGFRLRISSIEPWCLTDKLIQLLILENRIVPHFHIPLQSGSDKILKKMNRKYNSSDFNILINKLSKKSEDVLISTDIIVGFPSESEDDFNNSILFLENSSITYAHIFSYSDRPYAASTKLKEKVNSKIIKQRSKELHEISDKKRFSFYEKCIKYNNNNQTQEVIVEKIEPDKDDAGTKYYHGFSQNYMPIKFYIDEKEDKKFKKGDLVKGVKLLKLDKKNNSIIGIYI